MITSKLNRLFPALFFLFVCTVAAAQTGKAPKKYPSLLWEITGNGMKKPSYLFGTMHVSSKKVFHLSDSFFMAIRRADVVALELNPEIWQSEMVQLEKEKSVYSRFYSGRSGAANGIYDYSFRQQNDFLPDVKIALQEAPMIINSLLYRSRDYREDFEENTFLDMYIYQTAKKLGKRASGVESLFEMERLTTEAEIDQSKEKAKKKKKFDYDDDDPIMTMDEAYRKGDLDMLDSLDRMLNESDAYIEKFLYKRNEVQANSMDTIMKKGVSLFAGVGAAHLAGERGVIEELRKRGYKLRPIKMIDRDAKQRDQLDEIRVPVSFTDYTSEDGFFKLRAPGKLYRRDDTESGAGWQYADMSNGAYYMVTRVPTQAAYAGLGEKEVYRKIDSILYENIPGKILKKIPITRNGYSGMDITNKTRRGDIQRYNIFITPFEAVIFKMSGNENYVQNGKEAGDFFNSITLTPYKNGQWTSYQPPAGGFTVQVPHKPYVLDQRDGDWTWAAADPNGQQYLLLKRLIQDHNVKGADTLNLGLMEESFTGAEKKLRTLERRFTQTGDAATLNGLYSRNDSFMAVKYIISGPHHYILAVKGKNRGHVENNNFTSSFRLQPFKYAETRLYTDTFLKFTVHTPVVPQVRDSLKALLQQYENRGERLGYYGGYGSNEETYSHYTGSKSMVFANDTTGESILVSTNEWGKYYFIPDSLRYMYTAADSLAKITPDRARMYKQWDSLLMRYYGRERASIRSKFDSMYIFLRREAWVKDGFYYTRVDFTDTGSSRVVKNLTTIKGNRAYTVTAITGPGDKENGFTEAFMNSFSPMAPVNSLPLYTSKIDSFFKDYYSTDTSTRKLARSAIREIEFGKKDIPRMKEAVHQLSIKEKDYFDTKVMWIGAMAGIRDSTAKPLVIEELKNIYTRSADTSLFQNAVLKGLSGMHTKEALAIFKDYLLQDPPVETSEYSYGDDNFMAYEDSLELLKTLFPEILQLTTLDDYKQSVNTMLVRLVDSNRISGKAYETYFNKILFDARIALKKQQKKDEQKVQEELTKDPNDPDDYSYRSSSSSTNSELLDYATLLLPFYDQNPAVPRYIDKLWQTRDDELKFNLMLKLLQQKRPIPDTLVAYFAGREEKRGQLYYKLAKIKRLQLFPAAYKLQGELAKAFLYTTIEDEDKGADEEDEDDPYSYEGNSSYLTRNYYSGDYYSSSKNEKKFDSIELIRKQWMEVNTQKGWLYIYRYRREKEDKWRFAFSGLQPQAADSIAYTNRWTEVTEEKIKEEEEESLEDQLKLQVKKIIYKQRAATRSFFTTGDRYNNRSYLFHD